MRIAFFHYGIYQGGDSNGWSRTFNLSRALADYGHNVTIFTTSGGREHFREVIDVGERLCIRVYGDIFPNRWRRGGFSIIAAILKLKDLIRLSAFDICVADNVHRPSCLIPAIYLKYLKRTPVVSEWWELFGRRGIYSESSVFHKATVGFYDLVFEKSIRKRVCDGLCAISAYLRHEALALGLGEDQVCILHAGADQDIVQGAKRITKRNPMEKLIIGLIGANENEFLNNAVALDVCLELSDEGFNLEVVCTGEVDARSPSMQKYSRILRSLGWVEYEEFIEEMGKCHLYLLYQQLSVRNIARFPNKFGDYVAMRGFILSNCIGDLKSYSAKEGSPLICISDPAQIREFFMDCIIRGKTHAYSDEFIQANSWESRGQQLSQFLEQILRKSQERHG